MLRHVCHPLKNASMARKPPKEPLLVVLGATGTGKSQLAVDLAKRFDGEVINGDAMQMYHGLPIVTNKITVEEQQGILHHLLGFIQLDEEPWRVGLFKKRAGQTIAEIRSRGRLPILVGGTHYYTQSLLFEDSLVGEREGDDGNVPNEVSNQEVSQRFPILDGPTETIIQKLKEVDPIMAERWHPKDRRKIRRSLEIFLMTGKKASDIYAEQKDSRRLPKTALGDGEFTPSAVEYGSTLLFWVHSDIEVLKKRLDARVGKMIESGLLDEVKSMEEFLQGQKHAGIDVDRTRGIWVSIGWKEFEPYLKTLKAKVASEKELQGLLELSIEQTQSATRQYAKRQVRWIRLKLISALSEVNALDSLYLLDGSDIMKWTDNVSNPAIKITEGFLEGRELETPRQICAAAKQFLLPGNGHESRDLSFRRECEICNTTVIIEGQWEAHLKGRRHRALVKKQQKKAVEDRPSRRQNCTSDDVK